MRVHICLPIFYLFIVSSCFSEGLLYKGGFCDPDELQQKINKGADVNEANDEGQTALIYTGIYAAESCLDVLLKAGAHVNAQNLAGHRALDQAAFSECPGCVDKLLKAGADVDHQDKDDRTAIWYAARYGHVHVALKLLEYCADTTIITNEMTPLYTAEFRHKYLVADCIKAYEKESSCDEYKKLTCTVDGYLYPNKFNYSSNCQIFECENGATQFKQSDDNCCNANGSIHVDFEIWQHGCKSYECHHGVVRGKGRDPNCCQVGADIHPNGTTWDQGCWEYTCTAGRLVRNLHQTCCMLHGRPYEAGDSWSYHCHDYTCTNGTLHDELDHGCLCRTRKPCKIKGGTCVMNSASCKGTVITAKSKKTKLCHGPHCVCCKE
ncbi:unnamed protein product [Meganyctiphanes norvegica]|uniref:Ankyrin repeat domain-containing protein n=1 Tax=Meganyctiphanes norvegica TaxID=48144 RepID=A0AAV2PYJ1_MEGNR